MSAIWGNVIGVFIVIIMTTFIGIWIWAWRARHKPLFEKMAAIPMEDDVIPYQIINEQKQPVNKGKKA